MKSARRTKRKKIAVLPASSLRIRSLANLPSEFGCIDMAGFVRLFRTTMSSRRRPLGRRKVKRVGGTQVFRDRIAKSVVAGKTAMAIALELGLSLRLVDRVLSHLEQKEKRSKARCPTASPKRDMVRELANLPFLFGFESSEAFLAATRAAARQRTTSTWDATASHRRPKKL